MGVGLGGRACGCGARVRLFVCAHAHKHSFPTRRSSDLNRGPLGHPDSAKLFLGLPAYGPWEKNWKKNGRQDTFFTGLRVAIQNWPKKYIFFGPKK